MNVFFKKYIILLALFAVGVMHHVSAQVTVNASIDSLQLYIGEQARIKLEVSCPSEKQLDMPQYDQMLIDGIEIVGEVKADTQYLNKKSHVLVTHEYTVTSFELCVQSVGVEGVPVCYRHHRGECYFPHQGGG